MTVTHMRRDVPPWRRPALIAECGREIGEGQEVTDRGEWKRIVQSSITQPHLWLRISDSQARAFAKAKGICQICGEKATRWEPWAENPLACLKRFAEDLDSWERTAGEKTGANNELHALTDLLHVAGEATAQQYPTIAVFHALTDLVRENPEHSAQLVQRNAMLMALQTAGR